MGDLWLVVLLFTGLAVAFLFVRLPEEVDRADDDVDDDVPAARLRPARRSSEACRELVDDPDADPASYAEVTGYERWNLILVLMIVQVVQVLLLSLSVFAFLMVFGSLIMTDTGDGRLADAGPARSPRRVRWCRSRRSSRRSPGSTSRSRP